MDANRLLPRAIGALIFLLITALLLNHTSLLQPNFARIKDPSDRSNPIDSIKSNLQSIKLLFRRHDYACNLTSPSTKGRFVQSHLLARNRPLDYGTAICDGRRNWKMITDAFAGRYPPGREFTFEDVDNGWNYNENPQFLEKRWQAPLRYISNQLNDVPDNTVPDPEDTHYVEMMQDKEFVNDQEKMTPPTGGKYQSLIIPTHATLYAQYVNSPRSKLLSSRTPPPLDSLPHLLPPLHRLSDAYWFTWIQYESDRPERLRFIAQDTITNFNTRAIIDLILQARKGVRPNTMFPWPGARFEIGLGGREGGAMDGDAEGLALLGTPNSANVVWMLVDRARVLGKRRLRVHVFVELGEDNMPVRCMLWDMIPV
ncbi:MAG: hypothetical protein L6R35_002109 [Caloplaca aegaea]|nr:MAG: hypothetical protein L6R35_002109 [Caloplaca aegaea]